MAPVLSECSVGLVCIDDDYDDDDDDDDACLSETLKFVIRVPPRLG